jgi:hypothetical protein
MWLPKWKKLHKLLTYIVMSDSPILAYVEGVTMLSGLQKAVSLEITCLFLQHLFQSRDWTQRNIHYWGHSLTFFYCITNKEIYCTDIYVHCTEMYMYCIYSGHVFYRSIRPISLHIHFTGWGCQPLNPNISAVLNGNFLFDLTYIFQEHNPGIKWDMPYWHSSLL